MMPVLMRLFDALEAGSSIRETAMRLSLAMPLCGAAWRSLVGQGAVPEVCSKCSGAGLEGAMPCRRCRATGIEPPTC